MADLVVRNKLVSVDALKAKGMDLDQSESKAKYLSKRKTEDLEHLTAAERLSISLKTDGYISLRNNVAARQSSFHQDDPFLDLNIIPPSRKSSFVVPESVRRGFLVKESSSLSNSSQSRTTDCLLNASLDRKGFPSSDKGAFSLEKSFNGSLRSRDSSSDRSSPLREDESANEWLPMELASNVDVSDQMSVSEPQDIGTEVGISSSNLSHNRSNSDNWEKDPCQRLPRVKEPLTMDEMLEREPVKLSQPARKIIHKWINPCSLSSSEGL
jgi:hypothetical protein